MPWQHLRISRFGGPEVLEMVEESAIPEPGPGEVRIKVLAAGTGFTDTMIRRGRYPDFNAPLPSTPGYDIVGVVEKSGAGVARSMLASTGEGLAARLYCCPGPRSEGLRKAPHRLHRAAVGPGPDSGRPSGLAGAYADSSMR
jgi:NADPH:quinone reductase-like Zn-dependent oxidoreductase